MADEVQRRGGSAADHKSFTGAVREWTHDDDLEAIRVHDGATAGGFLLLRSGGVQSISADKTLALIDFGRIYDVDTSGADRTVTLPPAADATEGWQVLVRKAAAANKLTIATNASETIDGDSSRVLLGAGEAIILRSDGTNWVSVQLPAIKGLNPEHATDSGTDAYVSATNTTPPADGVKITRHFQDANETPTPTLDGKTMTTRDGSALWAGAVSGVHDVQYDSGADTYLVLEPNPSSQVDPIAYADGLVTDVLDAITDADTLTWHEGNLQSISTASYATIFDLASATELLGGAISGPTAGARLTVDGTVVFNRTSAGGGNDSGGSELISAFAIPPAKAASSMKLEVYNYSGATQTFGWRAVTR